MARFMAILVVLLFLPLCSVLVYSAANICPDDEAEYDAKQRCIASSDIYSKVTEPTLAASHLEDLPGFTRSVFEREYALITPESQVFSPLPDWINTLAAYLITPAMGAHFTMYLASMTGDNATSGRPLAGVERFVFVVKDEVYLTADTPLGGHRLQVADDVWLMVGKVDGFAYIPPGMEHTLSTATGSSATLLIIERRYLQKGNQLPELIVGTTDTQPLLQTPGEVFELRRLLPASAVYDFNIHVMDFQPGEFLNVKEVHYNQHGLLLLEGRGIYRLGDKCLPWRCHLYFVIPHFDGPILSDLTISWFPVQAGDIIWMAPFVPQWYAALGKTRSRYILYKDTGRDPLLHPY